MKLILAFLALLSLSAVAHDATSANAPDNALDSALAQARARHAAVVIDFTAPWCHSCYFMHKNVMTGASWEAVKKRAVIVEADGDSPEGSRWVKQYKVVGFPTYVVLDEKGGEVGRILGDRTRAKFYAELQPILERGAALEQWQAQVKDGSAVSIAAARTVLKSYYERADYQAGLDWAAALPDVARQALYADRKAEYLRARLALVAAAERNNPQQCLAAAPPVLGGALDCDILLELSKFQSCVSAQPPEAQRALLAPFKPRLEKLQDAVLVKRTAACNDTRGIVETAADLYDAIGDAPAMQQVLKQGVAYSERLLKGNYASDRNLADNLRFYLEVLGDPAALDALYPKLIRAWPDDYVYAYRWGKSLAKRGKYAEALPLLEQAAPKSYGRNRLWVAQWRGHVLMKLDRAAEARKQAGEALQANGPWFEKDSAELKAVLEGKTPA